MRISWLLVAVGALCAPVLGPAQAQFFVSGTGSDAGTCTRAAPCRTFQFALSVFSSTSRVINCVDAGDFGTVNIDRTVTIDCSNTFAAILAAGTTGITINAAGAIVILRGLTIEGGGTGMVGINVSNAAQVRVEQSKISGFSGTGIFFAPSSGANLFVTDSLVSSNGAGGGGGITIDPVGGTSLVSLLRVQLERNYAGLSAVGGTAGIPFVTVMDSIAVGNGTHGFAAISFGTVPATLDIQRSASNLNGGAGMLAFGTRGSVFVGNSMVTANGVGFSRQSGGIIRSYRDNNLDNNDSDGSASSGIDPQ